MIASTDTDQHPYYDGRGFPLDALSPDEFEKFVFSCLLSIQDILGLRITEKPTGSGDGGFDIQGEVIVSKRLACVQCKRQKEPLGTPQVAKELAKVAATAALESSDIGEHRFICTGGVRTKLRRQLREKSRQELALEAGERLASALDGELSSLRKRLEEIGADPRQVAESYVRGLDLLSAWGSQEFDAALSPCWNDVLQVAGRHFRIASVVREHPRASFDRATYIAEHHDFRAIVEPRLSDSGLPEGITSTSATDPNVAPATSIRSIKTPHELLDLEAGELAVLLGDGGIGKSTTLKLLRAEALRTTPDSTLPVLISLANYVPGGLDRAIHQELGIVHGTWRSLPDRVMLLCDGLNECSSANVAAFLEELKPLLKRSCIACVLSTRESTRHSKIILPQQPVACVKVEAITPIAIRRIAEHELKDSTTASFVAAYRSLADGSWSSMLWTPFAVKVALRLWRLNAALPATLGEMLEALLKARCARNAELPEHGPGPEVVLRLAGALAFQSIVVDRRLECPALEAGKCVREAKKHCADALGITDMTETQVVDLLARHELLQISEGGNLSFGHQLLAGALAAPMLSSVWRDYTDCLGEPVADDVWIFAARMVQNEHVEDFLDATFHVDLMLGARTARELPDELREFAEQLLDWAVADDSPETVRLQGLFALARLGSQGAIARLRKFTNEADNPIHYAACRALAATGDLDYLRQLLPKVDKMRSFPGIKMSGGDIGIWETAPLPTRLDLARQRLYECDAGEPVGESLSLLAYERDPVDVVLAEKYLRAATDLAAWQSALHALNEMSPTRATEALKETLSETSKPADIATLMHSASLIGVAIDIRAAFECAVMGLSHDESDGHANYQLSKLISDVVTKSPLPLDLVAVIERELPSSSGEKKKRLWQIATGCKSSSIAEYAVTGIQEWGNDLGSACNFFIEQPELARVRRQQLVELCEKGFTDERSWYDWKTWRALTLVGELGFSTMAADHLSKMIERLVRVQCATKDIDIAALSLRDAELLASVAPEHVRYHLGRIAAQLIPAAAKAREFLPDRVLLSLLYFDTKSYGVVKDLREALSGLSAADIDEVLNQIEESWTRLSGLVAVCAYGATEIRVDMLARELKQSYAHLAALNLVREAIEACWCKSVCEMVAKTVAEIPTWEEEYTQFFWDFIRSVSKRVRPDDQTVFETEGTGARTVFARRILSLWRDQASGDRVGLARLSRSGDK